LIACQLTNIDVSRNTAEVISILFCQRVKSQIKLVGTLSSETLIAIDSNLNSLEKKLDSTI